MPVIKAERRKLEKSIDNNYNFKQLQTGKKNEKTVKKSSSGVRSTGVSSKINQICMVIEKVNQENKPIENYTKTLQNIYGAVASELNISKSPVVDKCNRQLGLTAMEFAKYVRDYSEEGKDTLYDIVKEINIKIICGIQLLQYLSYV